MKQGMGILNNNKVKEDLFLDRVDNELKRAERYRIFISLIVLDVDFIQTAFPRQSESVLSDIMGLVQKHIRAIDNNGLLYYPYYLT